MKTTTPSRSALARRFVPVFALLMATTCNLSAAEAEKEPAVTADPHLVELPELVVTARRVEEHPLDVPAYTQVITREQIEKSGSSNLIELLKSQANLSFTSLSSSPANTTVSMRGTGSPGNYGNGRTLIVIDGIRANRPDMGEFNWLQFAVQDIESIEVIQGPQGGYYGDNAVGGVIKIKTRGVPAASSGQVSALVGSYDTVKLSGGYAQTFGNAWARVSGGHDESNGYRDHSGYSADSGAVALGYDNKKNSVTQFGASYIETDYQQPDRLSLSAYNADPTQDGGAFGEGWSRNYRVSGSNEFGSKNDSRLLTDADYFRTTEYSLASWGTSYDREISGASLAPKAVIEFDSASITPGVDLSYSDLSVVASDGSFGNLERSVIGPYLGGDWLATETLSLSAVARHEFNKVDAEGVNTAPLVEKAAKSGEGDAYQVAANYRPAKTIRFYAKYDHVYRFPATDEIAYYQSFFAPVFFNANLQPEKSDSVEMGADYQKGFWVMGGAGYHTRTKDEIFYNGTAQLNENIPCTERNGVQVHVLYDRCIVGFRARADYVSAVVVENDNPAGQQSGQLPMVPKWQTTETVFCRPLNGGMVELTHRHVGSSAANSTSTFRIPQVDFFDAKFSYDMNSRLSVYWGVNNFLDQKSISGAYGVNSIYPNEGRFIYLGSTYKF